jgi:hypothetical protein
MSLLQCPSLEEEDPDINNAWPGIVTTFFLYGAIFVSLLLVFECVRVASPTVYAPRSLISPDRVALPLSPRCFRWLGTLLRIDDDEMLRVAGLDAYTLVRFLHMNLKFSGFCLLYTFAVLVRPH